MDIKVDGTEEMKISWKSDGEDAYLQIADAKEREAPVGQIVETKQMKPINIHLDGVRRMSLLTGLLLFFSRSLESLHDRTFEKTMLEADGSFTGNNNITLITLCTGRVLFSKLVHLSTFSRLAIAFNSIKLFSGYFFSLKINFSTLRAIEIKIIQIKLALECFELSCNLRLLRFKYAE